jgi:hypothetical protein
VSGEDDGVAVGAMAMREPPRFVGAVGAEMGPLGPDVSLLADEAFVGIAAWRPRGALRAGVLFVVEEIIGRLDYCGLPNFGLTTFALGGLASSSKKLRTWLSPIRRSTTCLLTTYYSPALGVNL